MSDIGAHHAIHIDAINPPVSHAIGAGTAFENALTVTVNLNDRTKIDPIRNGVFGSMLPASTLIGVKDLAFPGMKREVQAVAGLP